jgi:hypothetical protein
MPRFRGLSCIGVGWQGVKGRFSAASGGRSPEVSDRFSQPAPRPGQPQPLRDRVDDAVEPAADVAHQRMAACEDRRRRDRLEAAHRPQPLLEKAMVAFDPVRAVAAGPVLDPGQDHRESRWIGAPPCR